MNIYDKKIPVRIKKTSKKSYPSITAKVPKVQKVKVINTPETKVVLPDVQKVEVINQETVKIPEIQKVEVVNPTIIPTLPDIHKVEVTNQIELPDIKIPDIQKVQVLNPTEIPIGNGNIAGKADPEKYVPVRLTDGKKFYKGLEDAYVSAAKTVMPYIDSTGKPTPVRMTNEGKVPVEATLNVGDIEIGAVEIKDGTSDTRAVVGSDGLQVEVKKSALPTGASTSANQTNGSQKTQIVDALGNVVGSEEHDGTHHLLVDTLDQTATGTLGQLNATVELECHGIGSVIMLVSGTWTGKIVFEGSIDSTWVNLFIVQPLGGITPNGIQNDNQNGSYRVLLSAGYSKLRARMSSYTSGSATVQYNGTDIVGTQYVWQLNQDNLLGTMYQGGSWTVTADQGGTWNINNISGTVSLPTGASTAANQSTANTLLGGIAGLVPTAYDYISLSYTGSDLTGVVFKTGGSGGTTVATLTLVYSGANLISVTKT